MSEISHDLPWFAVQVRSCREKKANAFLEHQGYQCFLPLAKSRRRWSDRIKVSETPLIPGYIFCRLDPLNRRPVLMAPWVMQIVGVGKTPVPVDENEIAALRRVGESGLPAQHWSFLQVGRTARIEQGPLRGLTGIILGIQSEYKLIFSVTLLKRAVAVAIDPRWLGDSQPMHTFTGVPTPIASIGRDTPTGSRPIEELEARALRVPVGESSSLSQGGSHAPQELRPV
jgi:transcription termination/antitermination protein NusG